MALNTGIQTYILVIVYPGIFGDNKRSIQYGLVSWAWYPQFAHVPNLPGKHSKSEIAVKLLNYRPETRVSSLCCVEMVQTPPNSR